MPVLVAGGAAGHCFTPSVLRSHCAQHARASMYAPPALLATNVWGAFHLWGYDRLCFIVTIQHLNHTCIGMGNRHIKALLVAAQLVVKIQAAIHSPYVS